jgi:hypothetical protein
MSAFSVGDIVYAENSFSIMAPAIVVEVEEKPEEQWHMWYRILFFEKDVLYWYAEEELAKSPPSW